MTRALSLGFLVSGLILLTGGCGKDKNSYRGPLHPVSGKISTTTGKSVASGKLTLVVGAGNTYEGPNPIGVIKDGSYTVKTGDKDGAPAGAFKVVVDTVHPGMSPEEEKKATKLVPDYSNPTRTPLAIEVKESPAAGAYDLKVQEAK